MNTPLRPLLKFSLFAIAATSGFAQALNLKQPDRMVGSVDALVSLTREQNARVTEIIDRAVAEVNNLPAASRLQQQVIITMKMRAEISGLLTAPQRARYERTPQMEGGGLSLASPEQKVRRLDELVKLSSEQKARALQIFTAELDALLAIPNAERLVQGAAARKTARDGVRSLLTPQQQVLYDSAPQIKGGGSTKGDRP